MDSDHSSTSPERQRDKARIKNAERRAVKRRECKVCHKAKPLDEFSLTSHGHPVFVCKGCESTCSKCKRELPPEKFPVGYRYGLECLNEKKRAYNDLPENKERRRQRDAAVTTRICRVCRSEKPLERFRKMKRKRSNVCMECESQRTCSQCNRTLPAENFREHHRQCFDCEQANYKAHNQTPERKELNNSYGRNKRGRARKQRYLATDKGRESQKRCWSNNQRSRQSRPEARIKICARQAVWMAQQAGDIIKPDACEYCKAAGELQAHHWRSYDREDWLTIQWLCETCHVQADKWFRAQIAAGIPKDQIVQWTGQSDAEIAAMALRGEDAA
jgi:hypothetical protein